MPSATPIYNDVERRHDFILLFEVVDGNPNGDPDAGNAPRVDPETMQGLVSDVAIKRRVRDYVALAQSDVPGYGIYVQHGTYLTDTRKRVFAAHASEQQRVAPADARAWMCAAYYDIRLFGSVMSMREANAGQVRGPLQLTFARSIDSILPLDLTIVGPAQRAPQTGVDDAPAAHFGTMGRKAVVPYGLYRAYGFFNPFFARQTGVTAADLDLFWMALQRGWDLDRSAARGMMACRGLYVFSHESRLGNAPAHTLFDRVGVDRKADVCVPRSFHHYRITVNDADLSDNITLTRLTEG